MNNLGLYFHIPFCLQKCPYCSFYSLAGRTDLHARYAQALITQLCSCVEVYQGQLRPLTSIFFGGGTPTLLSPEILAELLAECLTRYPCIDEAEISIEVNPATVDAVGLAHLRRAGFNRLSIGVQSLNDTELCQLGRPHTVTDAVQTVQWAREAGFDNINLDLMYGLPGQKVEAWQTTLEQALSLRPEHLSIYELTLEEGTPFFRQYAQGLFSLPEEEAVLLMLEETQQLLHQAGLQHYEISNYARPGRQCQHNINYWQNGEYLGFGAGAVAFLAGTRYTALADVEQFCLYMEQSKEVWAEQEQLDPEASFRETVIMGLRMTAGLSLAELEDRFGFDAEDYYGETLERLLRQGLLRIVQGYLQFTAEGLLLANAVMAELV
ncbi:MAG: radical SAM family heme chaperone HemW [Candidatus Electrothrix scaldis]|nr:MAG: radical SAM family heme chaperone HemW [Candidatus Electrothrix sp. GW3-3]